MPKFEVFKGGRKEDGPHNNRGTAPLRIIQGGRGGKERTPSKEIAEESTIRERKIFTKEGILTLIERVAVEEGFQKDQLETTREIYDDKGNLLILEVAVKNGRARGEGFGNISFMYMIRGNHGKYGGSIDTSILRSYSPLDKPDEISDVGIVAQYKNGEWELSPGDLIPHVVEIKPEK